MLHTPRWFHRHGYLLHPPIGDGELVLVYSHQRHGCRKAKEMMSGLGPKDVNLQLHLGRPVVIICERTLDTGYRKFVYVTFQSLAFQLASLFFSSCYLNTAAVAYTVLLYILCLMSATRGPTCCTLLCTVRCPTFHFGATLATPSALAAALRLHLCFCLHPQYGMQPAVARPLPTRRTLAVQTSQRPVVAV